MLNRIKKYFSPPEPKAIVLMYHRICNTNTDPWQLAVSPDNFENQIKTITKNFNVLPISNLIEQFKNKRIKSNCVYITFDDAYQDNYFYAKPILEKYKCPATFFVPTHFIGKEQMFWWDELEKIILHSKELPNQLTLSIDNQSFGFQFEIEELTDEIQYKQKTWYWPSPPPTNRCKLYIQIWELLKPLPYDEIKETLNYIKKWADFIPSEEAKNYPMNSEQLKNLSGNKLFSLGMHTHTHPALASHSIENQLNEIENSIHYLENNTYSKVNAIAYPYGNYNNDTIECVKQNKIELGFTTAEDIITRHSSPLELGRLQVLNCNGVTLNDKLIKYLKS